MFRLVGMTVHGTIANLIVSIAGACICICSAGYSFLKGKNPNRIGDPYESCVVIDGLCFQCYCQGNKPERRTLVCMVRE